MKRHKNIILILILLIGIAAFCFSRIRWPIQLDQGWTPPVKVTESQNGMDGSVDLHKWHDTIILLQQRYDRRANSSTCSILISNKDSSNSWTQLPLLGVPGEYNFFAPAFDQASDRIMFEHGYIENDQLVMSVIFIRLNVGHGIQIEAERKWTTDKRTLLGETPPNVHINDPGKRGWPSLYVGVVSGHDAYIPFSVAGTRYQGNTTYSGEGPFKSGVFHSADSGMTWQMERLSEFRAGAGDMCRTKNYYYYFTQLDDRNLWFGRKPINGGSWSESEPLTKKPAYVGGRDVVVTEGDLIHVCWLDRRNAEWRFPSLEGPTFFENEVAYSHRKDADRGWSKAVILSKGVRDSYAPSISVEGDKIVVAWSGNQTSHAAPYAGDPNDVYFATSNDGGKTWAKPLRVTDVAKDGITAAEPQVAVQNGAIHLFYVQGKWDNHLQVDGQPSWPIYYTQRSFPN